MVRVALELLAGMYNKKKKKLLLTTITTFFISSTHYPFFVLDTIRSIPHFERIIFYDTESGSRARQPHIGPGRRITKVPEMYNTSATAP